MLPSRCRCRCYCCCCCYFCCHPLSSSPLHTTVYIQLNKHTSINDTVQWLNMHSGISVVRCMLQYTAQHSTQLYYTAPCGVCCVCVCPFCHFTALTMEVYTSLSSFAHFAPLFPPTHISPKQLMRIPSASDFFLHPTVDTVLLLLWLLLLLF